MNLYRYTENGWTNCGIQLVVSRVILEDGRFYYAVIDLDDFGEHSKEIKVSKKARNRLAWPTKIEAYNSYVTRKKAQLEHAKRMMKTANTALSQLHTVNEKLLEDNPDLHLCGCGRLVGKYETQVCEECERFGCDYCIRPRYYDGEHYSEDCCFPYCQTYKPKK